MSSPAPFRPEDLEDRCESCGAAPSQLCKPWCDSGYTAEDFRRDAERRDQAAPSSTENPISRPRK
ncbi:hypothetical protein [Streptomyces sp. NPDC058434]|uniref:hypothetical protein n=1 Tax=Streptomyces sp. NPDC058434 TaxID=3346498 RepID=UPI00364ED616